MSEVCRPVDEFSRMIKITGLESGPRDYTVAASPEQCAALCSRLDLQHLSYLKGTVQLSLSRHSPYGLKGSCIALQGSLKAQVTQSCVVSLGPVEATIDAEFSGVFLKDADDLDFHDSEGDDVDTGPEILGRIISDSSDYIDLGELFAQQLSLELNPFPRSDNIDVVDQPIENKDKIDDISESDRKNPFAVLEKLKNNI